MMSNKQQTIYVYLHKKIIRYFSNKHLLHLLYAEID